ncbi:hypothetical protein K6168_17220 [Streptomyces sp. FB2]|uniref:hypothetical protein n=1 Tax=Streptomyces sp. FB2 TaxID=2902454 RepID=UPI001F487F17|nr:hypothetical protein [Streptomyces sp. FB2]MCF2537390.1 hypothetical protein [Streptomyces sp. FB2]
MSATSFTALARTSHPGTALRRFLALDAVVTGANGLAYLVASGPLGRLLGVGQGLLLTLGALLALYAGGVALLAARARPAATGVRAVVEANLAWAVLSVAALALWLTPTVTGTVWILLQAAVVAAFAVLQHTTLRLRQESID